MNKLVFDKAAFFLELFQCGWSPTTNWNKFSSFQMPPIIIFYRSDDLSYFSSSAN